ncbi:MAG: heavy metal translocating P-type ATPase [Candidatus Zixiibacteriota bacterium]
MSDLTQMTLTIGGMHCASCVSSIEKGVSAVTGVSECHVNLLTSSAVVSIADSAIDEQSVISAIEQLGFSASPGRPDVLTANRQQEQSARRSLAKAIGLTLPLMVVAMWPMLFGTNVVSLPFNASVQAVICLLVLVLAGRTILSDGMRQLVHLRANMNSLIAIGTVTAFVWSLYQTALTLSGAAAEPVLYFDSVGMILTLILLGRYLESRTRGKAGQTIQSLMKLQPSTTTAIINNVEIEIQTASVSPSMLLLVKPGERIAADGVIVENEPVIDESMLTGESMPVEKRVDDTVIGGSVNGNVSFTMRVTATGDKTVLASIIRLVTDAQSRKADVQNLADRVAAVFVPVVLAASLATLACWLIFAPDSPLLIRSVVSVLIIACPCALGLATPTAIMAGTGRAAREGIIIRGGDILQKLSKIDTVLFDKTGTLTHGELEVLSVESVGDMPPSKLVGIVGAAESRSEHPVAGAISSYMSLNQIESMPVENVTATPGFGVTASYERKTLVVGNSAFLQSQDIDISAAASLSDQEMTKGRTVVFAALDGQVIGLFSLGDRIREEAFETIPRLKERVSRVVMLSGDNNRTAQSVAGRLGLDSYQAEVRPDQKKDIVESYTKISSGTVMVGDGINDAPALAAADVGIAIGSGTDVAIEAADVILIRSDLSLVSKTLTVSELTMRTIRQNLFWAFFYNILAVPIAAGALYPVMGITLSPMIAASTMAMSSLFVVFNSLRLSRVRL